MARDWVALYTRLRDDPDLNDAADPQTHRVWVNALMQAGLMDEDGRIGEVRRFAFIVRLDEPELNRCLARIGNRLEIRDGELWVRDWEDHQTARKDPTAAERQRRARDRRKAASRDGNVMSRDVTLQDKQGIQDKQTLNPPTPHTNGSSAPPHSGATAPAPKWTPVLDRLADVLGTPAVYRSNGRATAGAGKFLRVVGAAARDDVETALALVNRWLRTEQAAADWAQWLTIRNAHERFAKWASVKAAPESAPVPAYGGDWAHMAAEDFPA